MIAWRRHRPFVQPAAADDHAFVQKRAAGFSRIRGWRDFHVRNAVQSDAKVLSVSLQRLLAPSSGS
jgi:hypothetical protein